MFKKTLVFSIAVMLVLMGLCSVASAAQNVANTSQKGSLLVYPKVMTFDGWDTIIMIGNDNTAGITIKCLWMNEWQEVWNLEFGITMNQPVWFRASDGVGSTGVNGFGENHGELKCFAINFPATEGAAEQQVAWNHLYGSAIVYNAGLGVAFEYPAWAFTARGNPANGAYLNPAGYMPLSGGNAIGQYDACPAYLIYNFFSENDAATGNLGGAGTDGPWAGDTWLALSPCYQDLRQERTPTCTKAKFDVWNENERKLTGAYRCIKCWYEGELEEIESHPYGFAGYKAGGAAEQNFTYDALHTNLARVRVTGVSGGTVCAGVFLGTDPLDPYYPGDFVDYCPKDAQVAVPFIGVRTQALYFTNIVRDTNLAVANTGTGAGTWAAPAGSPAPAIWWDAAEGVYTAPTR